MFKTHESLDREINRIFNETGVNVAELKASDLYRDDLGREVKQALRYDLLRRK